MLLAFNEPSQIRRKSIFYFVLILFRFLLPSPERLTSGKGSSQCTLTYTQSLRVGPSEMALLQAAAQDMFTGEE